MTYTTKLHKNKKKKPSLDKIDNNGVRKKKGQKLFADPEICFHQDNAKMDKVKQFQRINSSMMLKKEIKKKKKPIDKLFTYQLDKSDLQDRHKLLNFFLLELYHP